MVCKYLLLVIEKMKRRRPRSGEEFRFLLQGKKEASTLFNDTIRHVVTLLEVLCPFIGLERYMTRLEESWTFTITFIHLTKVTNKWGKVGLCFFSSGWSHGRLLTQSRLLPCGPNSTFLLWMKFHILGHLDSLLRSPAIKKISFPTWEI